MMSGLLKTVNRRCCLLLLVLGVAQTALRGQAGRTISTKDGLPQSFVSGLEQDKAGFIWVGTRNGLARYDGVNFKVFRHNNSDSASLASNLIITIKKFYDDIWIEHESGEIDHLDPASEQIRHYAIPAQLRNEVFLRRAWLADSAGIIWRIRDGAGLVRHSDKPVVYRRQSNGFDSDTLWGLLEGRDGLLWVLTQRGISSLNRASGKIVNYGAPQRPDYHDYSNAVRFPVGLHQRNNGDLMWVDRQFVYFFSPVTKKFLRKIPLPGQTERGVPWIRTGPDGSDFFERSGAVYRYHDDTGLTLVYGQTTAGRDPLQSFLVDRSGLLWFGTNAHGISQLDLTTPFFPSFPVKEGFAGDILALEFGQSISRLFDWQPGDQRFAAPGYHIRSAYGKDGTLWMGLKEKVVKYSPDTKTFSMLPKLTQVSNPRETGIGIKGLAMSPDGAPVVVGYNRNVMIYRHAERKWDWLVAEGAITRQFGHRITPQDIWLDSERIWITTEMDGLIMIDRETGKMHQHKRDNRAGTLPTDQLLGLEPDLSRPDLLWIGSYNGLICFNKKTLKAEVFNTDQGLPDNTIYSLLTDQYGKLWFGTNKGLCSFSPITHKVRVFQTRHGLLEDEFNRFHQLKLPDGHLAFGGTEGWTRFHPDKIRDDIYEPAIALTTLKVNNEEVPQSGDGILTRPLNAIEELRLPYDQNTVSISFAGLQFNQPQDLRYRYQLKGYDRDWVVSGHVPFANYTKIPNGQYEFVVNTSNTAGRWSKELKKLKIIIHPPWWRTWWAYATYLLVIGGAIRYWFRLQLARMELRKSVELKQQEARQLRMLAGMKERFFTNVTHDFRTPLTLILSPLAALIRSHSGTPDERKLVSIKRNAEQLLALINQLLDFSKLDAGVLSVQEAVGDIAAFTGNTVDLFREEASKKGIELLFEHSVQHNYLFDAPKLERMLGNLIGNALKFTDAGGTVKVLVAPEEDHVVFAVSDTGIGIPADQIPYVFDRYHQVDPGREMSSQKGKGTGIGLALVKELAELQHGRVTAESAEGKGSTFSIRMPYQPAGPVSPTSETREDEWESPVIADEDIRILLLEDNAELSDFIAGSLPGNYRIDRAADGAEGLKMAITHIPDLIISDVMMPVMDGFEFCRQVKQHEHTNHIPVILLTARTAVESRIEGLMKGADDYLAKPFHVPELNLRVYNLLERQRKLRARIQKEISAPQLENATEAPERRDPFLLKFFETIEQNLDDSSLGVEELSSLMHMSRSQLHRKLRAIAGMPVSDVVRNYRLTRSADFLKAGFNSSESAYKSGFDSPAYFSKCFREFYGMTPSDFQKGTI